MSTHRASRRSWSSVWFLLLWALWLGVLVCGGVGGGWACNLRIIYPFFNGFLRDYSRILFTDYSRILSTDYSRILFTYFQRYFVRIIYVFLLRIIYGFFLRVFLRIIYGFFLRVIYVLFLRVIYVFFLRVIYVFFLRVFLRVIYVCHQLTYCLRVSVSNGFFV